MKERWIGYAEPPDPPKAVLARVLTKVFGGAELKVARLRGGFRHHNYHIQMRERRAAAGLLLRLYEGHAELVEHDAEVAKHVPVRAPRYLGFGELDGFAFGLREFFPGQPMHEWLASVRHAGSDDRARQSYRRVARALGRCMATIHERTYERPGRLDEQLRLVQSFSFGGLVEFIEQCANRAPIAERLGPARLQRLTSFVRAKESVANLWGQVRLVHGDFGPTNIVVGPNEELGFLDWEYACAATPAIDFGNLLRGELGDSREFVSELAEGYTLAGGELPVGWQRAARIVDLSAWVELAARKEPPQIVLEDARRVIDRTLNDPDLI